MFKDIQITVKTAFCDNCGEDVQIYRGFPYVDEGGKQYCPKCAYALGILSKREYLEMNGMHFGPMDLEKVEIANDEG